MKLYQNYLARNPCEMCVLLFLELQNNNLQNTNKDESSTGAVALWTDVLNSEKGRDMAGRDGEN